MIAPSLIRFQIGHFQQTPREAQALHTVQTRIGAGEADISVRIHCSLRGALFTCHAACL